MTGNEKSTPTEAGVQIYLETAYNLKFIKCKTCDDFWIEVGGLLWHLFTGRGDRTYLLDSCWVEDETTLELTAVYLAEGLFSRACIGEVYLICHILLVDA